MHGPINIKSSQNSHRTFLFSFSGTAAQPCSLDVFNPPPISSADLRHFLHFKILLASLSAAFDQIPLDLPPSLLPSFSASFGTPTFFILLNWPTTAVFSIRYSWLALHFLVYFLTPWSRVLKKLTRCQLVKKFPTFYGNQRFITVFTSARHLSLSWASWIQCIPPHTTCWRPILILSSHLRPGFLSELIPSRLPTKTLYTPLPSPIRATCSTHLFILSLITRTILGEE